MEQQRYETISKYDLSYGAMRDSNALMTPKPSTIKYVQPFSGKTETFIVQTARTEKGDTIFLECVDEGGMVVRLALPPQVTNAIAAQRDSLTSRRRSISAKLVAKGRKERGELPGFLRKQTK
jgi:hypothetical protein